MSQQITEAFVKQFEANLFHLSQQKGSRLRGAVRVESQVGKSKFFERLGAVVAQKKTSRHSDTPLIDTPHSRRRVTLVDYEHADLIDDADKRRLLIDPAGDYALAFQNAFGRAMDDEIIAAMHGNAFSGEEGTTTVALPNSQKLASVSGGSGARLNVEALRRAKKIFDQNEVDESIKRWIAPNAEQMESLLSETETTSSDFNTVKALVRGELDTFMGFTFIRSERNLNRSGALSFNETTGAVGSGSGDADLYDQIPAWASDGIVLSIGADMMTRMSERADKSHSLQVFAQMGIGATRLEEEKVVQILCKPTA